MTREEMVARKLSIDARLGEFKTQLKSWKREAAATGKFRPVEEIRALEEMIARFGQRSQRIQQALSDLRLADKRGTNAWFELAAKEILSRDVFFAILDRAKELRLDSLEEAGFVIPDPIMDDLEE
jgi:hypothetical protein